MEERLVELEIRSMHQDKMLSDLSEIIYRQELSIRNLEHEIRMMKVQMSTESPSMVIPVKEDPPPHY